MTNKTTSIIKLSQNEINIVSGNRFSFTMAQFVIMGTLLAGVGLTGNGTASIKKVLYGGFATGIGFGYAQSDDFNPQDLMKKNCRGNYNSFFKRAL